MDQILAAGASGIDLPISCPPCHFGVDFAKRSELVAHGRTLEEIREFLGVDSLHYLSLDGLLSCMERPPQCYCEACFGGDYRLDPEHSVSERVIDIEQLKIFGGASV